MLGLLIFLLLFELMIPVKDRSDPNSNWDARIPAIYNLHLILDVLHLILEYLDVENRRVIERNSHCGHYFKGLL